MPHENRIYLSISLIYGLAIWLISYSCFWVMWCSVSFELLPLKNMMFLFAFLHFTISMIKLFLISSSDSRRVTEQYLSLFSKLMLKAKPCCPPCRLKSEKEISQLIYLLMNMIINIHYYVEFCIVFICIISKPYSILITPPKSALSIGDSIFFFLEQWPSNLE